jgi:SAM-dependent methyltransferase
MLRDIFNNGILYTMFQKLVGKENHKERKDFFSHQSGIRVLDIGCGPGNNTHYFLDADYYGLDLNCQNIDQAKKRYSKFSNVHLICADVNSYFTDHLRDENNKFDLIIMAGVLHHLTDEEVKNCLISAKSFLKKTGEFRSLDGVFTPRPSGGVCALVRWKIAQCFLLRDRGKYVRKEKAYLDLLYPFFPNLYFKISTDMLRIPYQTIIINPSREI